MEKIIINDFETAIEALIANYASPDFFDYEMPENFVLSIKMEGTKWDGQLDFIGAEFVIRLQKAFLDIYNHQFNNPLAYNSATIENNGLRITVKLAEGCSLFNINLGEWWHKMKSGHKAITLILGTSIIAGATAGYSLINNMLSGQSQLSLLKEKNEFELRKIIEERVSQKEKQEAILEQLNQTLDFADRHNYYMTLLANNMDADDKMLIAGKALTSSDAKKLYRHHDAAVLEDRDRYFLDGEYAVASLDCQKNSASVIFPDKRRRALSLNFLNKKELALFYGACAEKVARKEEVSLNLQVTVFFSKGVFKEGFIAALGFPREGTVTLADAVMDSSGREEDRENKNIE